MGMPMRQNLRIGSYLLKQKLRRVEKFPLVLELEPLFACNLACAGCGKIQQPAHLLKQRMPVEQAVGAVRECGAPVVSIAGGEPLMHPQIEKIVEALIADKRMVLLCTNAVLLPKHLHKFTPAPRLHLGRAHRRSARSPRRVGVQGRRLRRGRRGRETGAVQGFSVATNTTFFNNDTPQTVIEVLDYLNDELGVDNMQISPGYAYGEGARPGALPRRAGDPRALQEGFRRQAAARSGG